MKSEIDYGYSALLTRRSKSVLHVFAICQGRKLRNPLRAHRALSAEAQLGLLLPCNVVVQQDGDRTRVSAVDAQKKS